MTSFTEARKAEVIQNWQYLLVGAQADLRRLPLNHHDRSFVEEQLQVCQAKIEYYQNLPTVEEEKAQQRKEDLRHIMNRAHEIRKQAMVIWGPVDWSECLKAAWKEDKTGQPFQIIRKQQIFLTRIKKKNTLQIRSSLLKHSPLILNQSVFTSLKNRGVIQTQENTYTETARLEARTWEEFLSLCMKWERKLLHRAVLQAQIQMTQEALDECQRQHWQSGDLEQKLSKLTAELAA